MKKFSSTFRTNEVTLFLAKKFPYASTSFAQDMVKYGDNVDSNIVENWFKRYFPTGPDIFREMECECIQTIQ